MKSGCLSMRTSTLSCPPQCADDFDRKWLWPNDRFCVLAWSVKGWCAYDPSQSSMMTKLGLNRRPTSVVIDGKFQPSRKADGNPVIWSMSFPVKIIWRNQTTMIPVTLFTCFWNEIVIECNACYRFFVVSLHPRKDLRLYIPYYIL